MLSTYSVYTFSPLKLIPHATVDASRTHNTISPPKYLISFRLSPSLSFFTSFFPSFSKSHPRIPSKPLTFSNLGLILWLILKHLQGPYKSVIFTSYQERKNLRRSADMDDNIDHQKKRLPASTGFRPEGPALLTIGCMHACNPYERGNVSPS